MFAAVSTSLALFATAQLAFASPTLVNRTAEPEVDLLRRQNLATVYDSCNQPNHIALTFDDGPYIYEREIVDTLNRYGAKGTFFINGNNYRCIYDSDIMANIQYVYQQGHLVASHSWSHPDMTTLSWDEMHDQMWRVELAMTRILGATPAWFRPPYGNYNDLLRQVAAIRNQQLVLWDFDSGDSVGASVQESENDYQNEANARPNNLLALNHETYQTTAEQVLPYALNALQNKGYQFVTVADCVGWQPWYYSQFAPGTPDSSWNCD